VCRSTTRTADTAESLINLPSADYQVGILRCLSGWRLYLTDANDENYAAHAAHLTPAPRGSGWWRRGFPTGRRSVKSLKSRLLRHPARTVIFGPLQLWIAGVELRSCGVLPSVLVTL
jgi:hypothetical protein